MNAKRLLVLVAGGLTALSLVHLASGQKLSAPTKPKLAVSIKPQHVANALRAVIQSDREVYAAIWAAHPPARADLSNVAALPALPGPCEVLRRGAETVASKGVEYSYVLRALEPVNPRNRPETEVETKGLQFVANRPDLAYSSEELLGGRWYFTAVYPDVAVQQSCLTCHNQRNTGKVVKLGDVLGGLVIRIALEL